MKICWRVSGWGGVRCGWGEGCTTLPRRGWVDEYRFIKKYIEGLSDVLVYFVSVVMTRLKPRVWDR